MKQLPKKYDATDAQSRWKAEWLESGVYEWDASEYRDNSYVIDTPPPTVSGHLHMGHIFSYTQADFVARYQRMKGKTVFYPMGFDDNGLPTERLVEKTKKIQANRYIKEHGREGFIELCEGIAEEARRDFRELFQTIALSVDWKQEYHTISDESRKISQLSFLDLYEKERTYRKLQPMMWDPVDQTAIAQAEVEDKELASTFNDILFGVEDSDETITIGTTRPELIPACVGIFYHPDDERYQHLDGKQAISPLFGVKVPVMADDTVEMDKGTGIMMCCTFGDEADIVKWQKHDLPARMVIDNYAKMRLQNCEWLQDSPADLLEELEAKRMHHQDKNVPNARAIILEKLEKAGLLVKSDDIVHAVPCAERSGSPLEIIPTNQWFIKILDQKEQLKAKIDACTWRPEFMKLRAHQWVDGLSWDWCISRQRYFGVPFPVWYARPHGQEDAQWVEIMAQPEDLPTNPLVDIPRSRFARAGGTWNEGTDEQYTVVIPKEDILDAEGNVLFTQGQSLLLRPEMDVMDTWATSSVSPQLNSRAITGDYAVDAERHKQLFPADLRPQAHEIIRTWAFYTIVKAHLHEDTIPWHNLMISGWCLASDKTKMSKSKGNVVTPLALIEEHGTDAVRYWASTSRLGSDTAFSEDLLKIGKKLVNKLFNASKFAAIQLENLRETPSATTAEDVENGKICETIDLWILARLNHAITRATEQFEEYEYCAAREAIEDFFWNDFCDNYLEIVKKRAYNEDGSFEKGQQSAMLAMYHTLEAVLRLFAPFVPFITEELYSHLFDDKFAATGSIHSRGNWPAAANYPANEAAEQAGIATRQIIDVVRKAKGDAGVSIKWPIDELTIAGETDIKSVEADLAAVTNASVITWTNNDGAKSDDGNWNITTQLAAESDAA